MASLRLHAHLLLSRAILQQIHRMLISSHRRGILSQKTLFFLNRAVLVPNPLFVVREINISSKIELLHQIFYVSMEQENNKISHLEAVSREPNIYYVKSSLFVRIGGKYDVIGRIML